MFEALSRESTLVDPWTRLAGLDVATLARLARQNLTEMIMVDNRILLLAAVWADAHPGDTSGSASGPESMLVERSQRWGGGGDARGGRGAACELAVVRDISEGAAQHLIADAWISGIASESSGRRSAQPVSRAGRPVGSLSRTPELSIEAAGPSTTSFSPVAGQVAWRRLQVLLDAAILQADPEKAIRDAEQAAGTKGVWSAQGNLTV